MLCVDKDDAILRLLTALRQIVDCDAPTTDQAMFAMRLIAQQALREYVEASKGG